jgi:hypothetical protein
MCILQLYNFLYVCIVYRYRLAVKLTHIKWSRKRLDSKMDNDIILELGMSITQSYKTSDDFSFRPYIVS